MPLWDAIYQLSQTLTKPPTGNDLYIYWTYATYMKDGLVPYIDFHPEYPPLAFLFIYFPYFITTNPIFYVFLYKCLAVAGIISGTYFVYKWRNHINDVWLYLFLIFLLQSSEYALILGRFDIFSTVCTIASAYYFFVRKKEPTGWLLLLIATFIKLYPIVLLPVFLYKSNHKKLVLWYIVPFIIINAVLMDVTNGRYLDFVTLQGGRPIGYESILASFFLIPHILFNTVVQAAYALNSLGIAVDPPMQTLVKIILWMALLAPFIYRYKSIKHFHPLHLCVIVLTCFILGNIAFSPQYLTWLFPFVIILAAPELILFAIITGLTAWFFSFWGNPANVWLIVLISVRNILFLIFYFRLFSPKAAQHFPEHHQVK